MFGGHAMTAITAITAQNSLGVQQVMTCHGRCDGPDRFGSGRSWCRRGEDRHDRFGANRADARRPARGAPGSALVFDPVMVATSGAALADSDTIAAFDRLARLATVTTPNLPELAALAGRDPNDGRRGSGPFVARTVGKAIWQGGARTFRPARRQAAWPDGRSGDGRGSGSTAPHPWQGCTWPARSPPAWRGGRGGGFDRSARTYVRLAIEKAPSLGAGHGPMGPRSARYPGKQSTE